jgi:predicted amidophosphoribosyltransferase
MIRPNPTHAVEHGGPCPFCAKVLPEGRAVTFCPHCGQNVTVRHCPACSSEVEPDWRYCVTCEASIARCWRMRRSA